MPDGHIYAGRVFVSLEPGESRAVRVVRFRPGSERVEVSDSRGRGVRLVKTSSLRPSAYRADGTRYRTGYAPKGDRSPPGEGTPG